MVWRFYYHYPYLTDLKHEDVKEYIINFVDKEMINKRINKIDKIQLSIDETRMCIWVCFKRCKLMLDDYEINLDMNDVNSIFGEYLTLKNWNLKKKYSFEN